MAKVEMTRADFAPQLGHRRRLFAALAAVSTSKE
jgi:hypothetical protein